MSSRAYEMNTSLDGVMDWSDTVYVPSGARAKMNICSHAVFNGLLAAIAVRSPILFASDALRKHQPATCPVETAAAPAEFWLWLRSAFQSLASARPKTAQTRPPAAFRSVALPP